jgi:prolipoprotein diacylglyceryltransferase
VAVLLCLSFYLHLKGIHPNGRALIGFLLVVPIVIVASRGVGLIRHWKELPGQRVQLIARVGFHFHGGLIGGIAAGTLAALLMGVDALVLFDGAAWGLLLGQSIGRLGCLHNGCCYGKPSKSRWSIVYRDYRTRVLRVHPELHGIRLHPAPLYDAILSLAGFMVASIWVTRPIAPGILAGAILTFLGCSRVFLEDFRYDIHEGGKRDWTTAILAWISVVAGGLLLTSRLLQQGPSLPTRHPMGLDSFASSVAVHASWLLPLCTFTFLTALLAFGVRLRRSIRRE